MHWLLRHLHDTELWADYMPRVPAWLYVLALLGTTIMGAGVTTLRNERPVLAWQAFGLGVVLVVPLILLGFFIRWRTSLRFSVRKRILDSIAWRGDETVLDVGCGSGLLLNGAALRLKNGKAVGIDTWLPHAGGGDSGLLWRNARLEGVADRIEFKEADARRMPSDGEAFDVVLCGGAMHHISRTHADFEQTTGEIVRVLRPGGQIVIWDVVHMVQACASRFVSSGVRCEVTHAGRFLNHDMAIVFGKKTG